MFKIIIISSLSLLLVASQRAPTPTIYGYLNCKLNECKQQCPTDDQQCLMGSYNYQSCIQRTEPCQRWESMQSSAKGTDLVSKDYQACQTTCMPQRTGSLIFWDRFICDANCAGISLMTIKGYNYCKTNVCDELDCSFLGWNCQAAQDKYDQCKEAATVCIEAKQLMSGRNLESNDLLPREFFDCSRLCRPTTNSTEFLEKYRCEMEQCSGFAI